jgi:hypothetical protein
MTHKMPKEKSARELQRDIELRETLDKEREVSDDKYSIKLIEKIVIGMLAAFGLGVIGILVKVVADYVARLGS